MLSDKGLIQEMFLTFFDIERYRVFFDNFLIYFDEKYCVFSWLVSMGEYKKGLYGLGKGMCSAESTSSCFLGFQPLLESLSLLESLTKGIEETKNDHVTASSDEFFTFTFLKWPLW